VNPFFCPYFFNAVRVMISELQLVYAFKKNTHTITEYSQCIVWYCRIRIIIMIHQLTLILDNMVVLYIDSAINIVS
jgi:hypothetical protein